MQMNAQCCHSPEGLCRGGAAVEAERALSPAAGLGTHTPAWLHPKAKGSSLWAAEQVRSPAQKAQPQFKFLLQKPKRTSEIT